MDESESKHSSSPRMEKSTSNRRGVSNFYDYVFNLEEQVRVLQNHSLSVEERAQQSETEVRKLREELKRFKTPPLMVGTVQEVLPNGKCIVRNSNGVEFMVETEFNLGLLSSDVGKRVAMSQKNLAIVDTLPDIKDHRARAMELVERPAVDFSHVGGLEKEIELLKEAVILPMTHPKKFERLGIESPSGILLHGSPGTGKTLLAKAVAKESNAAFIGLVGSELVQKYIGEGARLVRDVFSIAKERDHCIIFIDEIDSIGAVRTDETTGGDREVQRTLIQLLAEIDGFKDLKNVKVIAATNRMDVIDPALLRPGRFDRLVEIPLPDEKGRKKILEIYSRKMNVHHSVKMGLLVSQTEGLTGADLKALCMEAGMNALRKNASKVRQEHFEEALAKIVESRNFEENDDPSFHNKMLA
jgi:proteasome regulatory subunit